MDSGLWLSITEYQNLKKLSVSTIRRYIKADRVKWKLENKRYYIFLSTEKYSALKMMHAPSLATNDFSKEELELELKLEIERLKSKVRSLETENNDLLMLVSLYEGKDAKKPNVDDLPELPAGL